MASIHPIHPPLNMRSTPDAKRLVIQYYLEDHIDKVLEATPLQITYKAYDHDAALLATSSLLAHGLRACFYPVPHFNQVHWHVDAHI